MAIKLEKEELESLMPQAMASVVTDTRESSPQVAQVSSAPSGAKINAIAAANPLKIANFWEDDPRCYSSPGK